MSEEIEIDSVESAIFRILSTIDTKFINPRLMRQIKSGVDVYIGVELYYWEDRCFTDAITLSTSKLKLSTQILGSHKQADFRIDWTSENECFFILGNSEYAITSRLAKELETQFYPNTKENQLVINALLTVIL